MATLIEGGGWAVDAQAAQLHSDGLTLAVEHARYSDARIAFNNATDYLSQLEPSPDVQLQEARVVRDVGFTAVREGLKLDRLQSINRFAIAETKLESSLDLTSALLHTEPKDTERYKWLLSEHGATLSCLGRTAVARQVKVPASPPLSTAEIRAEQRYFGKREAHHFLKQGSNMYYLVSNAMQGARAERINGKFFHMAPWLGRAAAGIATAALVDGRSFLPSVRTAAHIGLSLRTKKTAVQSVLQRP